MNLGSKNKISADGSMSSMTDLVFLMLIFFIILSTMISPGIPVNLPKGESSDTNDKSISVSVAANLQHYVNNEPVSIEELVPRILSEMEKPGNKKNSLLLRIDETVPTGVTVNILDIAKQNEWKVAIATQTK